MYIFAINPRKKRTYNGIKGKNLLDQKYYIVYIHNTIKYG